MIESCCTLTGNPAALAARGARPGRDLGHGLVWTPFDESPRGTPRDFLYLVERERPFRVIVRSVRPPRSGDLWNVERSYPFRPVLEPGQLLAFRVTCVATTWTRTGSSKATKRQDVIMAAWKRLPDQGARATPEELAAVADKAALDWLERQGAARGFELPRRPDPQGHEDARLVEVLGYDRHRLPRGRGARPAVFGPVTFEGLLRVTDPDAFRRVLAEGLGTQRAFGMGLVQIARPRVG